MPYKIFLKKLDAIKWYFDLYLAKRFILTTFISYFSSNFFVKKSKKKVQFYINYQKFNIIIKKN